VIGVGVVVAYRHLDSNITGIDLTKELGKRPSKIKVAGPQEPINVLVMGDDNRRGANGRKPNGHRIGGATPGLSDTTILLHLSADRKFAYGVSLPRDAMVDRPACQTRSGGTDPGGLTQFNAAYAIGGPACTIKTVEHLTGIRIDHYVVVDFSGFRAMVDAIHGVTVCVPHAVHDNVGHINMRAGTYTVDGEQALNYVRERHGFGDGSDIGRMKRQQTFIAAMINKVVSAGTLANPIRLYNFLDAATKSLTTDPGFAHLKDLASLGLSLKNIGLDQIRFITVPWEPWPADPNRIEWAPSAKKLWHRIKYDQPLSPRFDQDVVTAANTPGSSPSPSPTQSPGGAASQKPHASHSASPSPSPTSRAQQKAQAEMYGLCA
ncbi:MAG TPA: LCP family protein, partial [Marmoricola sp.]|nr:LCP family protein [Marmoricola sp.]